jgi:dTDP-glucose 4,6-dehydratase
MLRPNSPYAASKAAAEHLCLASYTTHNIPVIITRCSNNYGPYQFPEKLIPLVITNSQEGRTIPLYGDGLNVRDWIYVFDHCRALETVLQKGVIGEIYNIGTGNERTNLELIRQLLKLNNKPESLIQYVSDRLGHDRRYAVDTAKINNELGWQPLYPYDQSLASTVNWYLNNQTWWRQIKSGDYAQYYDRMYLHR